MNAHDSNSGEIRNTALAELRRLRQQVQAITGGAPTAPSPVLGVVTDGFPVIRPAKTRRYADDGPASA